MAASGFPNCGFTNFNHAEHLEIEYKILGAYISKTAKGNKVSYDEIILGMEFRASELMALIRFNQIITVSDD